MNKRVTDQIEEYLDGRKQCTGSGATEMLLEFMAMQKDHELKNQLLKELVMKYSAAERRLVELNQVKNKFLGMAAHDLRNPLTSVRGFSDLLLNDGAGSLSDTQREFLTIIYQVSDGMLNMVNDLLDISAIESGKFELHLKWCSIERLVEERLRINRILAERKGITFHEEFSGIPDALIDPNRIAQVIDNLIGNAIKFSEPGSKAYVWAMQDGVMAKVSIRDEGPGIPPEDMKKVFEEYQKSKAKPTGGEKSTGLGLAIARKIVEAHRGTLGVESSEGVGSTFYFTIPMMEGASDEYRQSQGSIG